MNEFKLTIEEANILDKLASATKMDAWFYIDEDLHIEDVEEDSIRNDAEGVCLLEDGLAYPLCSPQSGKLTPEEEKAAVSCFARAREWVKNHPAKGTWLLILGMSGEPSYAGKVGQVEYIDDAGQIHGTWGGCALVPGADIWERCQTNPCHYNDGAVDIRDVPEFCMMALTSVDGRTTAVGYDDNFYHPTDLLRAYLKVYFEDGELIIDADAKEKLMRVKAWLVASNGCEMEDLEEDEDV